MIAPLLALLALCPPSPPPAPGRLPAVQDRVLEWGEDLLFLVAELERLHPEPYFGVGREEFAGAVDRLIEALPEASDDQVTVELMRLVALLSRNGRDGHSGVWPLGFRLLPVQLYRFADGWFVVAAEPARSRLVGARVLRVGELEIEEACGQILPLVSGDNDIDRLAKLPTLLLLPELLHALGITTERSRARLVLERPGEAPFELELEGGSAADYAAWNAFPPEGLPEDGRVRWLRSAGPFWMETIEPQGALYVRYAAVRAEDGKGLGIAEFAREIVRRFEGEGLRRLVLDVRRNGGGDNTTFGPLVEALRTSEAIDRRGALFVLADRGTFSAAANFVTVVQRETAALLVGEPTGGAPNQYGDAVRVPLAHHPEVMVRISTRYHGFGGPDDHRLTHDPDVPVALSSADYFAARDPVLAAALAHGE